MNGGQILILEKSPSHLALMNCINAGQGFFVTVESGFFF
jgi:hypothetical protein